jgi:transposase
MSAITVDGASASASANIYTLVETCKANGIEPYFYLTWHSNICPSRRTSMTTTRSFPWKMPADPR